MATVLITGGSGLIGTAISKELISQGHHVIILTRNAKDKKSLPQTRYAEWDPKAATIDSWAISEADHIFNLAGAGVADERWSEKRKNEIEQSRILSGNLLVQSLKNIPNKVRSVVSASAIGWYGPDPSIPNPRPFKESDPPYDDFLGETCVKWESAILPVEELGKRLVILRTGIVLSRDGGAYKEFVKPLKLRVASILGSGKQYISWIHINDLVKMYLEAMENENYKGIYNAVAPHPVDNKTMIYAIGSSTGKFFIPAPVPSFVLKIMLGEMSIEVLKSTTVSADKILDAGFHFEFAGIEEAVKELGRG
jgi:uncharacterized protein